MFGVKQINWNSLIIKSIEWCDKNALFEQNNKLRKYLLLHQQNIIILNMMWNRCWKLSLEHGKRMNWNEKKNINIKIFNIYMDFKLLKISLKFWIIKFLFTQQKIYRRHIHMHWAQSSSNKCSKSITKHLDIQNNIRPNSILPHNLFISACVLFIVCICYSVKIGSPVVRSQRISLDFRKVRKILCI